MPCVVFMDEAETIQIVRTDWVEEVNSAESRINGTPPNRLVKIFYSPNKRQKPDFELEIREDFDCERTACYYGYVLKIFGKNLLTKIIFSID